VLNAKSLVLTEGSVTALEQFFNVE